MDSLVILNRNFQRKSSAALGAARKHSAAFYIRWTKVRINASLLDFEQALNVHFDHYLNSDDNQDVLKKNVPDESEPDTLFGVRAL